MTDHNDRIARLLKTEGKTRVFQMEDGTVVERKGGSASWRNNNPSNLKFEYAGSADPTVRSTRTREQAIAAARLKFEGVVALDQWGNAIFATVEQGRAAKLKLLRDSSGNNTVPEMLRRYSRADYSGETHHDAQAQSIYKTGDSEGMDLRGKRIRDMTEREISALADGIAKFEGWTAGQQTMLGWRDTYLSSLEAVDFMERERGNKSPMPGPVHAQIENSVPLKVIQQNLNTLGIRDAQGRELAIDGIRGGAASLTNEAIATFQQRFGLQGELTGSELVIATQAALDARRALDFERSLQDIVPSATQRDFAITEPHSRHAVPSPAGDDDSTAVTPVETARLPPMPPVSSLQPGERGAAVFALQEHLHLLNAHDAEGNRLKADRDFGGRTREAVENFQLWTGLPTTGVADRATLDALVTHAAFALDQRAKGIPPGEHLADNLQPGVPTPAQSVASEREMQARHPDGVPAASVSMQMPMPYGDPAHPKHALYVEAKTKLGELGHHLPDERLHQITAQMDLNGMRAGPQNRYAVRSDNNTVYVVSDIPGVRAHQTLDAPAPSIPGTMQQVQAQQLTQAAECERWAQMSGTQAPAQGSPAMSHGPMR